MTGSDSFGASVSFEPGESRFEPGVTPQQPITLDWETFSEASNEASLSRLYGGIHFEDGDLNGRTLGQDVAVEVFEQAQFYINGGQEQEISVGSGDADELIGTEADEEFYGRSGEDTIAGGLGNDQIFGGDQDDVLRGDLNTRSTGSSVGGDDTIHGGLGNDRIGGKGGNDQLFGNQGDDAIWGDDGDDLLRGGFGNDTLTGDDFSGGQGADTFVLAAGEGTDLITDFEIGIDRLQLDGNLIVDDLSITQSGVNTVIDFGSETLAILESVDATGLTANDFFRV